MIVSDNGTEMTSRTA